MSSPSDVPEGWHVVNPRYMKRLKAAERAAQAALDEIPFLNISEASADTLRAILSAGIEEA